MCSVIVGPTVGWLLITCSMSNLVLGQISMSWILVSISARKVFRHVGQLPNCSRSSSFQIGDWDGVRRSMRILWKLSRSILRISVDTPCASSLAHVGPGQFLWVWFVNVIPPSLLRYPVWCVLFCEGSVPFNLGDVNAMGFYYIYNLEWY